MHRGTASTSPLASWRAPATSMCVGSPSTFRSVTWSLAPGRTTAGCWTSRCSMWTHPPTYPTESGTLWVWKAYVSVIHCTHCRQARSLHLTIQCDCKIQCIYFNTKLIFSVISSPEMRWVQTLKKISFGGITICTTTSGLFRLCSKVGTLYHLSPLIDIFSDLNLFDIAEIFKKNFPGQTFKDCRVKRLKTLYINSPFALPPHYTGIRFCQLLVFRKWSRVNHCYINGFHCGKSFGWL